MMRLAVIVCGLTLGVLWLRGGDRWPVLVRIFHRMDKRIFAGAMVVYCVGQIAMGFRWWLLLRSQSVYIGFWTAVKLNFLGLFYNNFMPGSVGGDLVRAWYVTRHTDRKLQAALSVFVDRVLIGLLGTFLIAVCCYFFYLHGRIEIPALVTKTGYQKAAMLIGAVLLIIVAFVLVVLFLFPKGRTILSRAWLYLKSASIRILKKLKNAAVMYLKKPGTILITLILTILSQLLTISAFWYLGRNLGVDAGLVYYYFIFALTWVFGAIPVSVGGAVVVEGLLVVLFNVFCNVQNEPAVALALAQRLVWMLISLPGAIIHLAGAHLPKDFSVDYNEFVA
jgi:glycosyltransferase 2 family protein